VRAARRQRRAALTLVFFQQHLLAFGRRYEQIAAPFQWKFTRQDLHKLLAKTDARVASLAA
jgi:hypothetical protein